MTDLLQEGQAWLADQLTTHASQNVVYARDADEVAVLATIGKTTFEHDDGQGAIIRTQVRDYLIDAPKLVLAGEAVLPKPGDRIKEVEGGHTYIYEAMAIAGEPCWRYSDPFRLKLRIHTKLVDEEVAG
ncbi:MAG: hypothetical protein R3E01_13530 [Pirellulaceae bacterium]